MQWFVHGEAELAIDIPDEGLRQADCFFGPLLVDCPITRSLMLEVVRTLSFRDVG
ncbi:Uncharacterised protein [Mycobacterium tuberculosis]|uniref:Uncharacterized protein n=1 Tax=Mycobacterium tuberculosis TaxID=1773 RepID=A0A0U0R9A3_MYCTX|nr:Uncharacterised protein [Mycobacterium tuberculosis]